MTNELEQEYIMLKLRGDLDPRTEYINYETVRNNQHSNELMEAGWRMDVFTARYLRPGPTPTFEEWLHRKTNDTTTRSNT
jgi:hypothetical protein